MTYSARAPPPASRLTYPDGCADYRASFRKTEAEDGWQRLLAWFKQHGVA